MNGTDPDLVLDAEGVCNHCHSAQKMLREIEAEKPNLAGIIEKIKKDGHGNAYDVLCGLSGGVDSSYALVKAVELGLRPLCFSVENGWSDDRAQANVMKLVEGLKVPFIRYTIDLKKFHDLQAALMRGGIKNLEVITDHVLFATTYEMAALYRIKWIVSGGNVSTESVMPSSFGEDPRDLYWIKSVYRKVTGKRFKGLPMLPLWKEQWYRLVKRIMFFQILNYLDINYNRADAIKFLEEKYGWQNTGEKHEESVFTKWFQNFYLYQKYGIDKRVAHFSSLINSGQMTRAEAMEKLKENPVYPRLGIEEKVMKYPKGSYYDYPNSERLRKIIIRLYAISKRTSNS